VKRGAGERVWLTYDSPDVLEPGDYLRTGTGRTYLIDSVRVQRAGKHAGRQHLICTVMPDDHTPETDARVAEIRWYPRRKASR
jgi:hypothetical protein